MFGQSPRELGHEKLLELRWILKKQKEPASLRRLVGFSYREVG